MRGKSNHLRAQCCFFAAAVLEFLPPLPKVFYRAVLFFIGHTIALNHADLPPSMAKNGENPPAK